MFRKSAFDVNTSFISISLPSTDRMMRERVDLADPANGWSTTEKEENMMTEEQTTKAKTFKDSNQGPGPGPGDD